MAFGKAQNRIQDRPSSSADRPRMDELFPATRLVRIKHAGHWVHSEQPEVFVAALERFLVSVESP